MFQATLETGFEGSTSHSFLSRKSHGFFTSATITLGEETSPVNPGAVAIIPAGVPHSLEADQGSQLEFVIFGTPPMSLEDERAKPRKV